MKQILLVIPSTTYRTHDFMAAAEKLKLEITVASDHRQAMAALVPDASVALSFRKPETIGEKIIEFVEKKFAQKFPFAYPPFDAVVAVDDTSAYIAAIIAKSLEIPHNSPLAVKAARNKFLMRQKIAAAGLNCPNFRVFSAKKKSAALRQTSRVSLRAQTDLSFRQPRRYAG